MFSPCVSRFSQRTCSELYQLLPTGRLLSVSPVNCGYGSSNCCRVVLALFRLVAGSRPAKGLAYGQSVEVAEQASVRLGDALPPYCRSWAIVTESRLCETGSSWLR